MLDLRVLTEIVGDGPRIAHWATCGYAVAQVERTEALHLREAEQKRWKHVLVSRGRSVEDRQALECRRKGLDERPDLEETLAVQRNAEGTEGRHVRDRTQQIFGERPRRKAQRVDFIATEEPEHGRREHLRVGMAHLCREDDAQLGRLVDAEKEEAQRAARVSASINVALLPRGPTAHELAYVDLCELVINQ